MGIDLGTLGVASLVLGGIGTAFQAYGAYQQGQAESAAAKYNAQVAQANAQIQRQNADWAKAAGAQQEESQQMQNRAKAGAIIAEQGASGVDVGSGSFQDVQESQRLIGEQNAINIRAKAARDAYGYETEAAGLDAQAGMDKATAKNASSAGTIGAASSLIGGAANLASNWGTYLKSKSVAPDGLPYYGGYDSSTGITWNSYGA